MPYNGPMEARTTLTIDDFERLPADIAENHELVDGELIEVSGNTLRNNELRDLLVALMLPAVRKHKLGFVVAEQEYDFNGATHGPDVSFFGLAKQPLRNPNQRVQRFVPDLAIEVVSDSDTYNAILRKKERYLDAGVIEVWLISSETREITIYTKDSIRRVLTSGILATDLLPGISIGLEDLFRGL